MSVKKQIYIEAELDWAEQKLLEWKEYVDANPIAGIKDRWGKKEMPRGGATMVVTANVEAQIKCIRDTQREFLELLKVVKTMREAEEAKKKDIKGGEDRPERMKS